MSHATTALFCSSLPVNPRPFLGALGDIADSGEALTTDHAKRLLWTLIAIVRGQMARIDLAGNAVFHREHLERLPGRSTPSGVILSMFREAEGLATHDIRNNWYSSVSSLILFVWGDTGTLDMSEEWARLYDAFHNPVTQYQAA